jgi:hypothetical protein
MHSILRSRLPDLQWFSLDMVALHTGRSITFVRDRIRDGTLPSQKVSRPTHIHSGHRFYYHVHIDDLVVFIARFSNGKYSDLDIATALVSTVRKLPPHIQRAIAKNLR